MAESITYLGKRIYPRAKKTGRFATIKSRIKYAFKWLMVRTAIAGIALAVLSGVYFYGMAEAANTQTVVNQIIESPKQNMAAVLARIADCESGNGKPKTATQYENGQVLMRANKNGTIDIGKWQINLTYWGKKATELGYDLTKETDNEKMATWIYENKGTSDWSASQKCWYK